MKHLLRLAWLGLLWFGCSATLTACGQSPPARVLSGAPDLMVVELSPSLEWLKPQIQACAQEQDGLGIILLESPQAGLSPRTGVIGLRYGPSANPSVIVYQLGIDEIVLAVNPSNPLSKISFKNLLALFSGETSSWERILKAECPSCTSPATLHEVKLFQYPPGLDLEQTIGNDLPIKTLFSVKAFLAPDPVSLKSALTTELSAAALLPKRELDDSVREVHIDGKPEDWSKVPILALLTAEPRGKPKSWLFCLQRKFKE